MAVTVIGWIEFDPAITENMVYVQWQDALDLLPAEVEAKLFEGFDTALDMAPATLTAAPTADQLRKLQRAQILGARYHYARAQAGDGDSYGAEGYAMADMSRKLYLDMRTLLRPRAWGGVY